MLMFQGQTCAGQGHRDAACILVEIFDCLHQSFAVPGEKNCRDNWDYTT